jgi:hypothetical protein
LVQESQVILGWIERGKRQGILKAARANLLELVRLRLQDPVSEAIRLAVEGTTDEDTLDRWFRVAATAGTLAEFLTAMGQQPQADPGSLL